eukprot:scaffold1439_cov404-Prasinococcus_capsulatus_cf.AAC.32
MSALIRRRLGSQELFPIRLQAPLMFTVYALLSFSQLEVLLQEDVPDDYFDMPEGYTKKNFDETMELIESRHQSTSPYDSFHRGDGECQRAELEEVDSGDADTPEHLEESLAELIPSAEDIDKFFADNDDAQDTEDRSG